MLVNETGDTEVEKFIFVFSVFHEGGMFVLCGLPLTLYTPN